MSISEATFKTLPQYSAPTIRAVKAMVKAGNEYTQFMGIEPASTPEECERWEINRAEKWEALQVSIRAVIALMYGDLATHLKAEKEGAGASKKVSNRKKPATKSKTNQRKAAG